MVISIGLKTSRPATSAQLALNKNATSQKTCRAPASPHAHQQTNPAPAANATGETKTLVDEGSLVHLWASSTSENKHRTLTGSIAACLQADTSRDCPQKAVRLLLLKRQQLLLHILLWDIEGPRAQQAWMIIAGNACACGHGDAVCADANIDHMLAFGQLAMTALADYFERSSQTGNGPTVDPASSCLAESCIMAAQAINTAVQAISVADADAAQSQQDNMETSCRYHQSFVTPAVIFRSIAIDNGIHC